MALNLKQLVGLFGQSAGKVELPSDIRQFAAQLTVLTKHIIDVSRKVKELDNVVAELTQYLIEARGKQPTTEQPVAEAPVTAAAPTATPVSTNDDPEEVATQAMIDQIHLETAAEMAALSQTPPVVVSRKQNGGQKKLSVEGAS